MGVTVSQCKRAHEGERVTGQLSHNTPSTAHEYNGTWLTSKKSAVRLPYNAELCWRVGILPIPERVKKSAFSVGETVLKQQWLVPAECWSHLQTVDESPVIKYLAPIPAVIPMHHLRQRFNMWNPHLPSLKLPAPLIEHVAPTPDATFDEAAPASEHMAPAPDDTFAARAPVIQYEFATPSPVIEYSAPAPCVICFTPSPQSLLAYTMAAVTTGVTVDTTRSVNSQSPITDVGASASQLAGLLPPFETTNVDAETFRREKWNLCGAAMSDDDVCPRPRLCGAAASDRPPETAITTEHFELTADDSQHECLADGMPSCEMACPCRTATTQRVMIGHTARRWPVRRRGTCDARHTTREHKGEQDSNQEGAAHLGRQDRSICGVGRLHRN